MKSRTIIVSNRLPVQITKQNGRLKYKQSLGGLATGLKSVHRGKNSLWIGWCGVENDRLETDDFQFIEDDLREHHQCVPVFLNQQQVDLYYNSFSNKTLWPLFHHFPMLTEYHQEYWDGYRDVNQQFFETLQTHLKPGDRVWVHDYHLLLLPKLIRDAIPGIYIGLFLHIPFPSYEVFRLLPWRQELLEGMLGADLVGFHTYDYTRHFLSSVRRILRNDAQLLTINHEQRECHVDVFPMGIDYQWYRDAFKRPHVKNQIRRYRKNLGELRIILSVDRLDYTKGIPNRLEAFDKFLELYPQWKGKTALVMIAAPSRTDVDSYIKLKKDLDEQVSRINSRHGSIEWTPVRYFNKSFSSENLTALYGISDVLLVTPLRDGMNLVVKEYIACRKEHTGSVIISETAGAASELGEAFVVNANNSEEIAHTIHDALTLSPEEQKQTMRILNDRIEKNDVDKWAAAFLEKLNTVGHVTTGYTSKKLKPETREKILEKFHKAQRRLIFLDYDGTLVSFKSKPQLAVPDEELLTILNQIAHQDNTELIIISGRMKDDLERWLGDIPCHLVAGHGVWIRETGQNWELIEPLENKWKEEIRPILNHFTYRTPGSLIEEKTYSLAWHYRKCDPDFAKTRLSELNATLLGITQNYNLGIQNGNKVMEIKDTHINKGRAVAIWLNKYNPDFIMAFGDDWTDEDMFAALPESAISVKVGYGLSKARYSLKGVPEVRTFLKRF